MLQFMTITNSFTYSPFVSSLRSKKIINGTICSCFKTSLKNPDIFEISVIPGIASQLRKYSILIHFLLSMKIFFGNLPRSQFTFAEKDTKAYNFYFNEIISFEINHKI